MRTMFVSIACAGMALCMTACDSYNKPAATTAAPSPAPSAAPATPVPPTSSDASKGSMTSKPTEAGSAMGGTAPGNVTEPAPKAAGGPTTTGGAPEPTGGDGSKEAAKSAADAKTTK